MSVGWFSERSKRVVSNRPATTPLDVWLSPMSCTANYIPQGPFRIMRGTVPHNGWAIEYTGWEEGFVTAAEAIAAFANSHLPRADEWCMVADDRNQIILGWYDEDGVLAWSGCSLAFEILAIIHNPIDAAAWEVAARERWKRFAPLEVRL